MRPRIVIIENNLLATLTLRERLTKELMKYYDITVLSTGTTQQLNAAREKGFAVEDIGASTQNIFDIIRYMRRMRRALKNKQPAVCLTFTIRPAIWGNMVTRKLKIPTITNITGIGPLFTRNNVAYRFARFMYKYVLRDTKKIFFQNKDDKEIFLHNGFAHPEVTGQIPGSGIDIEYYFPKEKPPAKNFVFLFISRLVKDKGILEFVEAAGGLKKDYPAAEFRILGPVWLQNLKDNTITLKEIKQWEQNGTVRYLGETSDVRPFIAEADCIVLPSYREGTSNVLLEAASMERACITCDTTGCREVVEDGLNGYLCKVRDARDLELKMRKMYALDPEQRRQMGINGRKKVGKEFNKQIVIDAYLKAIQEILNKI